MQYIKSNNQDTSNNNSKEQIVYFCPRCHNIRVMKVKTYVDKLCNRCDSEMLNIMPKEQFVEYTENEKKKLIQDLKSKHPNIASPTEILLMKINDNTRTIKNILTFYLLMTLLGIFILFVSMN